MNIIITHRHTQINSYISIWKKCDSEHKNTENINTNQWGQPLPRSHDNFPDLKSRKGQLMSDFKMNESFQ